MLASSLQEKQLEFLDFYSAPMFGGARTYTQVWYELGFEGNLVDQKKPLMPDFEYKEVTIEEFLTYNRNPLKDLLVFYPLRVKGMRETLPVALSTRSHATSSVRAPVVLGIYAENGRTGFTRRGGILRIKNREFAEKISTLLSADFGIPIDTVLFTPQPGRPKYERISPTI